MKSAEGTSRPAAALATASEPMTPAAPPLFSTITLVPRRLASCGAIARAMTSLLPPGGKGTTMRMSAGCAQAKEAARTAPMRKASRVMKKPPSAI